MPTVHNYKMLTSAIHNEGRFRSIFRLPNKTLLHWFPGHMGKGLKQIKQKLKSVDCIIEVHDARIPFTGRNPDFKHTVCGIRPHILVLNKKDLADLSYEPKVIEKLKDQGVTNVIFSNCKDQNCSGMKRIVPMAQDIISRCDRFNRSEVRNFCIMTIGVPNVGKSSFINHLRNKHLKKSNVAPVGAVAGITRSVMSQIKVSGDPLIYVLDTPGILTPKVPDIETGMKLALCNTMQDHIVGIEFIADYLLFLMNKEANFKYVDYLGLKDPTDNITEALTVSAFKMNKIRKFSNMSGGYINRPDTEYSANYFVRAFRNGQFGKFLLDKDYLNNG